MGADSGAARCRRRRPLRRRRRERPLRHRTTTPAGTRLERKQSAGSSSTGRKRGRSSESASTAPFCEQAERLATSVPLSSGGPRGLQAAPGAGPWRTVYRRVAPGLLGSRVNRDRDRDDSIRTRPARMGWPPVGLCTGGRAGGGRGAGRGRGGRARSAREPARKRALFT